MTFPPKLVSKGPLLFLFVSKINTVELCVGGFVVDLVVVDIVVDDVVVVEIVVVEVEVVVVMVVVVTGQL